MDFGRSLTVTSSKMDTLQIVADISPLSVGSKQSIALTGDGGWPVLQNTCRFICIQVNDSVTVKSIACAMWMRILSANSCRLARAFFLWSRPVPRRLNFQKWSAAPWFMLWWFIMWNCLMRSPFPKRLDRIFRKTNLHRSSYFVSNSMMSAAAGPICAQYSATIL